MACCLVRVSCFNCLRPFSWASVLDTETLYTAATLNVTSRYGKDYPFELKRKLMGRSTVESARLLLEELQLPLSVDEYIELVSAEYNKVGFHAFIRCHH